jgi:ABC-2 type transport system permease protein
MNRWFRTFGVLFHWQLLQVIPFLAVAIALQALVGGATVVGLGLLIPHIRPQDAMFLATGGPTIALISVGLSVVPSSVIQAKSTGVYDYFDSLPIPRLTFLMAEVTVLMLIAVPGTVVALAIAAARFNLSLHPSPWLLPIAALVVLTSTALGYTIALTLTSPTLVALVTNGLLFGILLFSPINYPASRLPNWLQRVHSLLPVRYMADSLRSALTGAGTPLKPILVITIWCAASLALTVRLTRQK